MAVGPAKRVRYRGRPVAVREGEPLARALGRAGVRLFARSIRYHRPRAPSCGIGFCTNCLVRVNGRPNVRACRYVPADGDRVETENAWPSPRFDLLAGFDLLFPRGLDTLHGLRRPAFLIPLYQRLVRRLAGFGAIADAAPRALPPGSTRRLDTLVVGGGAAGRAFAAALSDPRGTLLVERGPAVGNVAVELVERTTAVFLPPPDPTSGRFRLVAAREEGPGLLLDARRVVVAIGGYDAGLLFPGNDRPGVLTADGAEALAPGPDDPGFSRAVLFGGGDRVAGLLARWGERVEAVAAPGSVGPEVVERANELGVPIYPRSLLLGVEGRRGVRAVRLAARGSAAASFRVAADALVLAHRRLPHPQLFFQAGARMEWRGAVGAYFPKLTEGFATSVPGLYAIGEASGFYGPDAAESGRRLGAALSGAPAGALSTLARVATGPGELEGYYRELLARPKPRGKSVACACEDVLAEELRGAHEAGYRGIEVMKRYTGLGTGLCQGRYCLPDAILLLALWEGRAPSEVGYITQRPPLVPTRLDTLAGIPPVREAGP
jgi:sarcosine oxidase, subunit alpha